MRRRKQISYLPALIGALALGTAARDAGAQGTSAPTVARTLLYRELTALTARLTDGPVLCGSGNRAVFAVAPATDAPGAPSPIFVVEAEGTPPRQVNPDAYGWVDAEKGIVQIPVEVAAERALKSDIFKVREQREGAVGEDQAPSDASSGRQPRRGPQ